MFDFGLGKIGSTAVLAVFVLGTLAGAYFLWESRVRRAAIMEEQNKQLIQVIAERDKARAEQHETWARFQDLPDVRQRICATRPANDGCCKPHPAECRP